MDQEDHYSEWIDRTLGGKASPTLKRILRRCVIDGGFYLEDVKDWSITMTKIDGPTWESDRLMLRIHRANNGFRSAEIRRIKYEDTFRTVAEADAWIDLVDPLPSRVNGAGTAS